MGKGKIKQRTTSMGIMRWCEWIGRVRTTRNLEISKVSELPFNNDLLQRVRPSVTSSAIREIIKTINNFINK